MRRAGLTGLTNMLVQSVSVLTGLASVPLTVGYLGQERYGVWLTLSSLLAWLAIADLGFGGNALINALSEARGRDDPSWAREIAATAFWGLVCIAVALGAIVPLVLRWVSVRQVFNVSSAMPEAELQQAVSLAVAAFLLSLPMSAAVGVFHGLQEGYLANLWAVLGSLLSLAALVAVTRIEGGLPQLVLAVWGARVLASGAAAIHLFWRQPQLLPSPRATSRRAFHRLARLGVRYLVVQLAGIGVFQSQPLIVAQILGPAQVAVFAIAQRILTLPHLVVQLLTNPLLPAYGEAFAKRDWTWIRRTFRYSLALSAVGGVVLVAGIAVTARPVIRFWVGQALVPEWPLVGALSAYVLVAIVVSPGSVLLFGAGRVGRQAIFAALNAVATVVLGVLLTRAFGLTGLAAAMAVGMAVVVPLAQWTELRAAFAPAHERRPD